MALQYSHNKVDSYISYFGMQDSRDGHGSVRSSSGSTLMEPEQEPAIGLVWFSIQVPSGWSRNFKPPDFLLSLISSQSGSADLTSQFILLFICFDRL